MWTFKASLHNKMICNYSKHPEISKYVIRNSAYGKHRKYLKKFHGNGDTICIGQESQCQIYNTLFVDNAGYFLVSCNVFEIFFVGGAERCGGDYTLGVNV